jgi:flagellar biosynthesis chaperone FliJ
MARDPMRMLRTVRLHAVEQARHALAECLRTETMAADKLRAIDEAAERDRVANRSVVEAHRFIDMFALHSQASATERLAAEAALMAARDVTAEARAALVTARTAAESVETLITERADAAKVDTDRREQHALDDMARARFDSPGR